MSNAVTATGILVQRGPVGATPAFVTIAEIVHVTPPGFSRNELESSNHNEGVESKVLGILRQRNPAFRVNYIGDDPTHQSIMSDILTNTKSAWRVLFPSGNQYTGDAYVQRFDLQEAPVDAIQQAEVGLSWAGPVTPTIPGS